MDQASQPMESSIFSLADSRARRRQGYSLSRSLGGHSPLVPYLTPQRVRLFRCLQDGIPGNCASDLYLPMPGVPKSRGCEACRKQRKKVGTSQYTQHTGSVCIHSKYISLIAFRSATSVSHHARDAPASSCHVMEAASNATYFSTIPIPKAKQSSLNNFSSVVTLSSTPLCKRSIAYSQTAKTP